eukprot:3941644-Rhodomonas_salina.20
MRIVEFTWHAIDRNLEADSRMSQNGTSTREEVAWSLECYPADVFFFNQVGDLEVLVVLAPNSTSESAIGYHLRRLRYLVLFGNKVGDNGLIAGECVVEEFVLHLPNVALKSQNGKDQCEMKRHTVKCSTVKSQNEGSESRVKSERTHSSGKMKTKEQRQFPNVLPGQNPSQKDTDPDT